jgi:hypothetical protein
MTGTVCNGHFSPSLRSCPQSPIFKGPTKVRGTSLNFPLLHDALAADSMNPLVLATSRNSSIYGSHLLILTAQMLLALDTWHCYRLRQALGICICNSPNFFNVNAPCSSLSYRPHYDSTVWNRIIISNPHGLPYFIILFCLLRLILPSPPWPLSTLHTLPPVL